MDNMTRPESVTAETLFDGIGEKYEDAYCGNNGLCQSLRRLSQRLGRGARVLDVGCGPGGPSSLMAKSGLQVTGLDVSQTMVDICRANVPGKYYKIDMNQFEPEHKFDGITCLFSLVQLSQRSIYSMLVKMASWLRPGGLLVLGCVVADELFERSLPSGPIAECAERCVVAFMDQKLPATMISSKGWLRLVQRVGLEIQHVDLSRFTPAGFEGKEEQHLFITAQRTTLEPLFGPYPQPLLKRAPHLLSQSAWQPFAERLDRPEFDAIVDIVRANCKVLDVGSGHGELPSAIARLHGKAYAIEPNADRNNILATSGRDSGIEVRQGTAEKLPYGDNEFDAVIASWILHYVNDLDKALKEMTRVVDQSLPNARIVVVQGAPDNEVVNLINQTCAPIAEESMSRSAIDHQGLLLSAAARIFTEAGFGDIELVRVEPQCNFPEETIDVKSHRAAEVLANFWYKDHSEAPRMQEVLTSVLKSHFEDRPRSIGDQAVILVAQPTRSDQTGSS